MRREINFRIKLVAIYMTLLILSTAASITTIFIVRDGKDNNYIYMPISNEVVGYNIKEDIITSDDIFEKLTPVENDLAYTDEEIDLISIITMAEAEGESELGQRLVIDVILNRVDSDLFPDTVNDVIYQKNQFTSTYNGRMDRCYVKDEIRALVLEEMKARTNSEVLYFRSGHYHSFGTPIINEGNHYFSK